MKNIIIILLLLGSTQVVGQYKKDINTNLPGIIGLSALPTSFIVSEINYTNFVGRFGDRDAYMQGSKLKSYESMIRQNESIIITGAIVTVAGLLVQHYITNKRNRSTRKSCWR
tara:strand:+ start:1531 stop:1869 length:339 start_codon:yes stop_codon:yes gene_type:complete